jgi:hypothetical protein
LSTQGNGYNSAKVGWAADDQEYVGVADDDKGNNGPTTRSMSRSTAQSKKQKIGKTKGKKGSKQRQTGRSIVASSVIPSVPFGSLSLGYGRNGCVFRADWQGQSVAVSSSILGAQESSQGSETRFPPTKS